MSRVSCYISHVTCHISHYYYYYLFLFFLTTWWSYSVEGLLSTGPTRQVFYPIWPTVKLWSRFMGNCARPQHEGNREDQNSIPVLQASAFDVATSMCIEMRTCLRNTTLGVGCMTWTCRHGQGVALAYNLIVFSGSSSNLIFPSIILLWLLLCDLLATED